MVSCADVNIITFGKGLTFTCFNIDVGDLNLNFLLYQHVRGV